MAVDTPSEPELIEELTRLRDQGLPRLRTLGLPALSRAARIVTLDDASPAHVVVENLLRRAVTRFGGGQYGDATVALFGLEAGTRGLNSKQRREIAADAFDRRFETFRKNQEPLLIAELAGQVLGLCAEQRTRDTRTALERATSPQSSAMPQVWLERFAAYYRIWTSVSGLGADLTAHRATLLDAERPYDRLIGTDSPDDPGYSQDEQAEGYATFALYHYAHLAWQLRQFVALYGGQWLLSDSSAEHAVADAVHRIWSESPWNERDESFLRMLIADTPDQEMHGFIERLRSTELGRTTEQEWLEWADTCSCTWTLGADTDVEPFPISSWRDGISEKCRVHGLIQACGGYLVLIDQDWVRLADWYHVTSTDPAIDVSDKA